ncbi:Hypothetical predicted protein [Mytilus galloprovincialis]|uniref:Uncharacterized protein n=1 Tax=Mytilus galloprovincialis TaxID=29158 RepID=A0A8B6GGF1_MYTGA|nr:Hypothetical predicted protein [Mytilus galloprovincialis]
MKKNGDIWTDIVTKHTHNFQLISQWLDEDTRIRSYYDFSDKSEKSLIYKILREHVKFSDAGLYACNISGLIDDNVATIDEVREIKILQISKYLAISYLASFCDIAIYASETPTEGSKLPEATTKSDHSSTKETTLQKATAQTKTTQNVITERVTPTDVTQKGIVAENTVTDEATN